MIFSTSLLSTKLSTPNYPHTGVAQLLGRVLIDDCLVFSLFDCWNLFFLMCPCLAGVSVGSSSTLDLGDANLLSVDGTINVEANGLLLGKVTTDQPCINVFPELTTVSGESDTIVYILRVVVKSGPFISTMYRVFHPLAQVWHTNGIHPRLFSLSQVTGSIKYASGGMKASTFDMPKLAYIGGTFNSDSG